MIILTNSVFLCMASNKFFFSEDSCMCTDKINVTTYSYIEIFYIKFKLKWNPYQCKLHTKLMLILILQKF